MSFNHGAVWWRELMTGDVAAAVDYYRDVFGWSFQPARMENGGQYQVAVAHGEPVAGITDIAMDDGETDAAPLWLTYVAVDDVEAAMEQTRRAGGAVVRAAFDVPGVGRSGIVRDPTGAAIGLMTPVFPGDALAAADTAAEVAEQDTQEDADENFPV